MIQHPKNENRTTPKSKQISLIDSNLSIDFYDNRKSRISKYIN